MKVAIALIYYKAVKPGFFIVEMTSEVWHKFLYASQRVRQDMIVPKVAPSVEGSVRELVWIPLDNQNKRQVVEENNIIKL